MSDVVSIQVQSSLPAFLANKLMFYIHFKSQSIIPCVNYTPPCSYSRSMTCFPARVCCGLGDLWRARGTEGLPGSHFCGPPRLRPQPDHWGWLPQGLQLWVAQPLLLSADRQGQRVFGGNVWSSWGSVWGSGETLGARTVPKAPGRGPGLSGLTRQGWHARGAGAGCPARFRGSDSLLC